MDGLKLNCLLSLNTVYAANSLPCAFLCVWYKMCSHYSTFLVLCCLCNCLKVELVGEKMQEGMRKSLRMIPNMDNKPSNKQEHQHFWIKGFVWLR